VDWLGLALVSLGIPLVVYALTALGTPGGTAGPLYLILAAAGLAATVVFVWWPRHGAHPVLRPRLAAHPVMAPALTSVLLAGAGMTGAVLLLPL
jgi:Co/Zn/Cd efflux system component